MNLNVMYELRDRLETAAIAGVSLIPEDFRLRRAVEQAAPLASASPVFQKIIAQAQQLTAPECPDRGGLLLDVLALLDAVLCTQGTLQTGGTVEPLSDGSNGMDQPDAAVTMRDIPYSVLAPVREAFCGTGGGRYAVLRDAHKANPEIFDDYRVVDWMVQALDDSYSDLADMAAEWLKAKGPSVVPLLKSGFRRDGKRDMERRLQVIDAVAGAGENDFYRSILEQKGKTSKGIREEAVFALRHAGRNVPFLLELVQKEKGSVKQAAQRVLAVSDGTVVADYWKAYMEEQPEEAVVYLKDARIGWAADLIAGELMRQMELRRECMEQALQTSGRLRDEDREALQTVWEAAEGKYSPKLGACYEQAYHFLGEAVPQQLITTLIQNLQLELCWQVEKLFQVDPEGFLEAYAVEVLLTRDGKTAYELLDRQMNPEGLWAKLIRKRKLPDSLTRVLMRVRYVQQDGSCRILADRGPLTEAHRSERKLPEPLDLRWYPLLLENLKRFEVCRKDSWTEAYDEMAAGLYRSDIAELQPLYGRYFYRIAMKQIPSVLAVRMMKRCGWTDYKGILTRALELRKSLGLYDTMRILRELPLTGQELADELDAWLLQNGQQNERMVYEDWRDALRSGTSPQDLNIFGGQKL